LFSGLWIIEQTMRFAPGFVAEATRSTSFDLATLASMIMAFAPLIVQTYQHEAVRMYGQIAPLNADWVADQGFKGTNNLQ
jgi:hypothetical protein